MTAGAVATQAVRLTSLGVRDFRNIARADLAWPAAGAVVIGANGHGKTNLLEAIHYGHALRSMRGVADRDAVRFGAPAFHLAFEATGARAHTLGIGAERSEERRKRIVMDGHVVPRLADAFATIPSVVLSPRDAELVFGPPDMRRRFLDLLLAATTPRYLGALQRYRTALAQRNAALRESSATAAEAAMWEGTLAASGAELWAARRDWVATHAEAFARRCADIGERSPVSMRHHTGMGELLEGATVAQLQEVLGSRLAAGRDDDLRRGTTQVGPHRDDLRLQHGGRSVRTFASAGQQRTMALALRLLEWETLATQLQLRPLLLLDDPFAELDRDRADRILAMLQSMDDVQRVLVVPREDEVPAAFHALPRWTIRDGVIDGAA